MGEVKIGPNLLKDVYPTRPNWSHKGDFGKLLIIGGSQRYAGSPALIALSALRTGADLVWVITPEVAAKTVAGFSPNIIVEAVGKRYFNHSYVRHVLKIAKDFDAVAIGSGMPHNPETNRFVMGFLDKVETNCVVDAEALYALKGYGLDQNFVLTPHANEFSLLSGVEPKNEVKERVKMVTKCAKLMNTNILLKGYKDVISDGKDFAVNSAGNPYMTVGGTGDMLVGVCGALLAKGIKPFKAACAAAYVSGLAGNLAAEKYKDGTLATDIIEKIPEVLR